jgi:hypothetical protein
MKQKAIVEQMKNMIEVIAPQVVLIVLCLRTVKKLEAGIPKMSTALM